MPNTIIERYITKSIPELPQNTIPQLLYVVESEYEMVNFTICNTDPTLSNTVSIAINVRGDHDSDLTKLARHYLVFNLEILANQVIKIPNILLIPGFDVWGNSTDNPQISLIIAGIKII